MESENGFFPSSVDKWNTFYSTGFTPWHKDNVHPMLKKFSSRLGLSTPKRVFVPLCGKSVDMKWLLDNGHTVVGVEGSEFAVEEFFSENEIQFTKEKTDYGHIYKAKDDRLQIHVCNIFEVDAEIFGKCDAIWDKGSFFIFPAKHELQYVRMMKTILKPDSRYLLMTIQYDEASGFEGPPRNLSHESTLQLFGDVCNQEVLQVNDASDIFAMLTKKAIFATESFLLLSPK